MEHTAGIIAALDNLQTHLALLLVGVVIVFISVLRWKLFAKLKPSDRVMLQIVAGFFLAGGFTILILAQIRGG